MCLTCGFSGPQLQGTRGEQTFICPRCHQDLYARPARSYADLEMLDQEQAEPEPVVLVHDPGAIGTTALSPLARFRGRVRGWLGRLLPRRASSRAG